jgi:hypothetical protein
MIDAILSLDRIPNTACLPLSSTILRTTIHTSNREEKFLRLGSLWRLASNHLIGQAFQSKTFWQ